MSKLFRAIGRDDRVRGFLCWLGAQYIRLVHATSRWDVEGAAPAHALWDSGQPFILAFWHGRILLMPYVWRRAVPIHMLISQHRDGQFIARTVAHFGIDTVAGSSSKGGAQALRAMLKALKAGDCVGVTPDGPRGPRMRATSGVVDVARLSGCPILPATYSARGGRLLGSWDRFLVMLPFTRGVFVWGAPITVPRHADAATLEALRLEVETSLTAITDRADLRMGQPTVPPDAPVVGGEDA